MVPRPRKKEKSQCLFMDVYEEVFANPKTHIVKQNKFQKHWETKPINQWENKFLFSKHAELHTQVYLIFYPLSLNFHAVTNILCQFFFSSITNTEILWVKFNMTNLLRFVTIGIDFFFEILHEKAADLWKRDSLKPGKNLKWTEMACLGVIST